MFEKGTTAEIKEALTKDLRLREVTVLSMELLAAFRTLPPTGKTEVIQYVEASGEHELAEALRTIAKDMEKLKGEEG